MNGFLQADPRRLLKMKEAKFPENIKGCRSFLGLVNSLKSVLGFETLRELSHLNPLTASNLTKFAPTDFQREVFERLKQKIISAPVYSRVICPKSLKILFVDASASPESCYSSVLAQVTNDQGDNYVPVYLNLDNKVDRIIHDYKLPCKPLSLRRQDETPKDQLEEDSDKLTPRT